MRTCFIFKRSSASEQRRIFAGPLVPRALLRPGRLPVVPFPTGLRFQAMHGDDAGEAYRLAVLSDARGAYNVAADPIIDAQTFGKLLEARAVEVPKQAVSAAMGSLHSGIRQLGVHQTRRPDGSSLTVALSLWGQFGATWSFRGVSLVRGGGVQRRRWATLALGHRFHDLPQCLGSQPSSARKRLLSSVGNDTNILSSDSSAGMSRSRHAPATLVNSGVMPLT